MKKKLLLLLFAVALFSIGCAGEQWVQRTDLGELSVLQGGRTGVFGTDNSWWFVKENPEPQPDILRLQESYTRTATMQQYDQKCPSPTQLKNIQTRTEHVAETRFRDVPNQKRPPAMYGGGGTNPSTGNVLLPAAAMGAGIATSGGLAPETKIITSGGNMIQGQDQATKNTLLGINKNMNANPIKIDNSAIGTGIGTGTGTAIIK